MISLRHSKKAFRFENEEEEENELIYYLGRVETEEKALEIKI